MIVILHRNRLNETGIVTAYAFDGAENVDEITGGQVSYLDLTKENMLWKRFDWVLSYTFWTIHAASFFQKRF